MTAACTVFTSASSKRVMIDGVTKGSHFSAVNWSSTASFQMTATAMAISTITVTTAMRRCRRTALRARCVEQDVAHQDTAHRRSRRLATNEISSTMTMYPRAMPRNMTIRSVA